MKTLGQYLKGHRKVPGWLDAYSARFIAELSRLQLEADVHGGVGEIGVHMGRLFILLKLLARPAERAVAIDVFQDQHLNTDGSGEGDEHTFRANVEFWAGAGHMSVLQRSSLEISCQDIIDSAGYCRLFSVDGGHTAQCTMNDLNLADGVLVDAGILVLDDYFNPSWPDVSTGAAQFLAQRNVRLRPFAITPNKLYFARPGWQSFYSNALRQSQSGYYEKTSEMYGSPVCVFGVEPQTHALPRRIRRWAKQSTFGPMLINARRQWRAATQA